MELLPGIIADGAALYLAQHRALVLSDLHIGYEEELRSRGVLLPAGQRAHYEAEAARLITAHDVARVILNGDVKHEFGRISQQEWSGVLGFIRHVRSLGPDVLVVAGNHDTMLLPILEGEGIAARKALLLGSILIAHGDQSLEAIQAAEGFSAEEMAAARILVIGHEHPALRLTDGIRTEAVKCFLVGMLGTRACVVAPAWNPLVTGSDVLRERPMGPLLAAYTGFSAFAVMDERVLAFGKIEALQRQQAS